MAKIEVTGNLGGDADLKFTPNGRPVLNFSVADSKSRKDQNGNWETLKEQWIRAALWGDEAEFYQSRLLKGTKVTVYGEFYAREYDANDGSKRTSLDVDVHGVKIWPKAPLPKPPASGSASKAGPSSNVSATSSISEVNRKLQAPPVFTSPQTFSSVSAARNRLGCSACTSSASRRYMRCWKQVSCRMIRWTSRYELDS